MDETPGLYTLNLELEAGIIPLALSFGGTGPAGKSAYQVWLEAGNSGTVEDFFAAISTLAIHVGTTPPSNPSEGTLWIDTN